MAEAVRLAMIGCGGMAGAHREGYQKLWEAGLRDFRITATCDVETARAEEMAENEIRLENGVFGLSGYQGNNPNKRYLQEQRPQQIELLKRRP